jgi:hypothetical protein
MEERRRLGQPGPRGSRVADCVSAAGEERVLKILALDLVHDLAIVVPISVSGLVQPGNRLDHDRFTSGVNFSSELKPTPPS